MFFMFHELIGNFVQSSEHFGDCLLQFLPSLAKELAPGPSVLLRLFYYASKTKAKNQDCMSSLISC